MGTSDALQVQVLRGTHFMMAAQDASRRHTQHAS